METDHGILCVKVSTHYIISLTLIID